MNMNRRGFLGALAALIGGVAVEQAIPLGRVWSFPSSIKVLNLAPEYIDYVSTSTLVNLTAAYYDRKALDNLKQNFSLWKFSEPRPLPMLSDGKFLKLYSYHDS